MRCKAHFNLLNRLGVIHECDRRADILLENATLNSVVRPKTYYHATSIQYT